MNEQLYSNAGQINAPVNAEYCAACVFCGQQTAVMMYPHRKAEKIVGWVFVCPKDAEKISGCDILIQQNES